MDIDIDSKYMKIALEEAKKAYRIEEVPIGAIIVHKGEVIARGYNQVERKNSPLGHAEIIAIDEACKHLGQWRLLDCTMYVTLEPCAMCAGAIVNSRIPNLIIGTRDFKGGSCGTILNVTNNSSFNHRVNVSIGTLAGECSHILSDFFKKLREQKK